MYVTKRAVSLFRYTYPVIHHNPPNLSRRLSVLRASLCIPSPTACVAGVKRKVGKGSSCTPLNSHTQNETVPPSSFPLNVCQAGYIHCVPINTVKAPVLSRTIKNQSCFAFPSMDSFDILLLQFRVQLNLSVRTPLYYGQFQCPDKILIYFL